MEISKRIEEVSQMIIYLTDENNIKNEISELDQLAFITEFLNFGKAIQPIYEKYHRDNTDKPDVFRWFR